MEELLYLDAEGLQRLFSQTTPQARMRAKREVASERDDGVEVKPKLELGHKLFGMSLSGAAGVQRNTKRKTVESEEMEWRPENQMVAVREYLSSLRRLSGDVYSATNQARVSGGSAFCDLQDFFAPLDWDLRGDAWRERANSDQTLVLEAKNEPALKTSMEFKRIVFGAPLEQIGRSSHMSLRFRQPVKLRILGTIDLGKYLKPYAASFL